MDWLQYFKEVVEVVKKKSKDERMQIGALIVGNDNQILSTGYNSFPSGINDDVPERQEKPEKYFWFEHAERNAIYNAAKSGTATNGATMYLSCELPCADCARAIINAGIKKIYIQKGKGVTRNSESYKESFIRSETMLGEAGVDVIYY